MSHTKHPYVDPALVEWLDAHFQPVVVTATTPVDEIRFNGGQRSVIDSLKNRLKKQETEDQKSFRR